MLAFAGAVAAPAAAAAAAASSSFLPAASSFFAAASFSSCLLSGGASSLSASFISFTSLISLLSGPLFSVSVAIVIVVERLRVCVSPKFSFSSSSPLPSGQRGGGEWGGWGLQSRASLLQNSCLPRPENRRLRSIARALSDLEPISTVARTTQTVRQALVARRRFLLAGRFLPSRRRSLPRFAQSVLPLPRARAVAARMRKRHTPPWSTYLIGRPPLPCVRATNTDERRERARECLPFPLSFRVLEYSRKVAATPPPSPLQRLAMASSRTKGQRYLPLKRDGARRAVF